MGWSAETSEGFLLAATVAGDRMAVRGRAGLAGSAQRSVHALVEGLSALPKPQRRVQIEAMSQRMTSTLGTPRTQMPPRALALLAPVAERALADVWLHDAPTPRLGYRAETGLRHVLRMIAEHGSWRA